ncbi:MAG TPA: M28 family peptidase [Pirellulales bacterium]|nr:M28 family peptidase [Pirellulales bacterium]
MVRKLSGQTLYVVAIGVLCLTAIGFMLRDYWLASPAAAQQRSPAVRLEAIPFDGAAAYRYLQQICQLGPRPAGSAAMIRQQQMLAEHFEKLGAKVERQEFRARNPRDGSAVDLANLIVHWHPDRNERLLVCAHYDTRPYPDRDPRKPRGTFIGANDGGSGVAVLMELGRHMQDVGGSRGVDFVLFDGEELIYNDPPDPYFLGSTHFARQYIAQPPAFRYKAGVLLDMVGDADLRILVEANSQQLAPAVVSEVWSVAKRLGVREFVYQRGLQVNDDHMPLNQIARIPTCDVIDFEYPWWHTEGDVANRCSALSLAKVGWVVLEWLHSAAK